MRILFTTILLLLSFAFVFGEDTPAVQAAKRERERRANLKPGRSFTNKDIQDYVAKHPSIPSSSIGSTPEPQTQTQTAETSADQANEQFWRGKHAAVKQRIDAAQAKTTQLQTDIDTLTEAFYQVSDENRRVEINDVRNKKLEELETVKRELEEANQAQVDLEDEARVAGALPGWIRD